jgi:hypothetical protein
MMSTYRATYRYTYANFMGTVPPCSRMHDISIAGSLFEPELERYATRSIGVEWRLYVLFH